MARRSPNSNRPVRPSSTPAKRKGHPPLAARPTDAPDLELAGLKKRTHESYLRAVRKVAYAGLKFFFCHTCPRDWPTLAKLRVPKQFKLPAVLTIPEVDQLIDTIRKPALKCFFWTVYSLGLRLQETLDLLRAPWSTHRHPLWLFPAEGRKHQQAATAQRPMADKTVQDCIVSNSKSSCLVPIS